MRRRLALIIMLSPLDLLFLLCATRAHRKTI
jgi:hypothetical protein